MNLPIQQIEPPMDSAILAKPHSNRDALMQEFVRQSGFAEHSLQPLAGDASRRRYIRVTTPKTSYMVMDAPPEHEPLESYIKICNFLYNHGYSAPRIIALDVEEGFLLLEDLGDNIFANILDQQTEPTELELYIEAVDLLAEWHTSPKMLKGTANLELPPYSINEYMREVAIFADWFLPTVSEENHSASASEFLNIWRGILLQAPLGDCYFVHRDFHVNNLIWLKDRNNLARVGLLDFQDAVWGDPSYDMVSLLEDARRDVSPKLASDMQKRYLDLTGQPVKLFQQRYAVLGAQRNLKIIGIFHRLSKRDSKPQYLNHLPRVWKYLENDLAHPSLQALKKWMDATIPNHLRS